MVISGLDILFSLIKIPAAIFKLHHYLNY